MYAKPEPPPRMTPMSKAPIVFALKTGFKASYRYKGICRVGMEPRYMPRPGILYRFSHSALMAMSLGSLRWSLQTTPSRWSI